MNQSNLHESAQGEPAQLAAPPWRALLLGSEPDGNSAVAAMGSAMVNNQWSMSRLMVDNGLLTHNLGDDL